MGKIKIIDLDKSKAIEAILLMGRRHNVSLPYLANEIAALFEEDRPAEPERLKRCSECHFPKCLSSWDKGYATTIHYATSSQDFPDDPPPRTSRLPLMRLCHCERGKQLREILDKAPPMIQAFYGPPLCSTKRIYA